MLTGKRNAVVTVRNIPVTSSTAMGWVAEYCFQQNIQYTWPQTTKDAKPGSGLLSDEITRHRNCNAAPGRVPGAPPYL